MHGMGGSWIVKVTFRRSVAPQATARESLPCASFSKSIVGSGGTAPQLSHAFRRVRYVYTRRLGGTALVGVRGEVKARRGNLLWRILRIANSVKEGRVGAAASRGDYVCIMVCIEFLFRDQSRVHYMSASWESAISFSMGAGRPVG